MINIGDLISINFDPDQHSERNRVTFRRMARVTEYLIADHRRLHELLEQAIASDCGGEEPFASFRKGLLRHIAIEQKILFTAVARARGEPLASARALQVEHAALTSLLVPPPDAALFVEINSLLAVHDAKEEGPTGVYAECELALSNEESEALAAEAAAYPEVRVVPHLDSPRAHRTAASALASARRMTPRK